MRRTLVVLIAGWLLLAGCSPDASKGYTVMFDGMPRLYSDQVYDDGVEIGRIAEKHVNPAGLVRMVVILNDGWAREATANIAFYPRYGRLEVEHFQRYGQPLSKDAAICGFSSDNGLIWFNIKTLLSDRGMAARKRAHGLHVRFAAQ